MLLGRTLFLTENLIDRRYPIEVNLNFVHIIFSTDLIAVSTLSNYEHRTIGSG